jgi:hypothetical protein
MWLNAVSLGWRMPPGFLRRESSRRAYPRRTGKSGQFRGKLRSGAWFDGPVIRTGFVGIDCWIEATQ